MSHQRQLFILLLLLLFMVAVMAQTSAPPSVPGIDTSALNARIEEATARAKAPGATTAEKKEAARAYLERANLYRDAGVPSLYKFALGDYRRVLRYDPTNAQAKERMDEIVSIYQSMGRPVPTNGLEDESATLTSRSVSRATESTAVPPTARRIRFQRGRSSAVLKGAIVRGTSDEYLIGARAGQRLTLTISSLERNAVFDLYKARPEEPEEIVLEKKNWSGVLAEDGDYLIRVGTERGNATYTLRVTIR